MTTAAKTPAQHTPHSGKLRGNAAMLTAKTFSGFNENALKFLLPVWMNAFTGVILRLGFGALFFWVLGRIRRKESPRETTRDRLLLLLTGGVFVFGFMYTLLLGLTYTTPISSSIFIGLQAAVVYVITLCLGTDRLSTGRLTGILLGIAGALVCILSQHHSDVASNPLLGNIFCLISTLFYAGYLVIEKHFLKRLSNATVSKYTFTGGVAVGAVVILITGQWHAPVFHAGLFSTPFLILGFVLVFPTCLSYLLTDVGLKLLPATVVALYSDWILVVATVTSYVLGQDHFSWVQIGAVLLMIFSVYLVERAETRQ